MGWKTIGGREYYYTCRRVNGRVVTQYIGAGVLGEMEEAENAKKRKRAGAALAAWRAEQARVLEEDQAITDICKLAGELTEAALITAGYHQHKGTWRKRRHE